MSYTKQLDEQRRRKAQKAFLEGDVAESRRIHTEIPFTSEPHPAASGRYIGDAVYGASDGIVTTFAVVAGVIGAALSPRIILVLGLANLLADGFSMAAGDFLAERSEQAYFKREREREFWEVRHAPDIERDEIREIYRAKGFEGEDLERVVKVITADETCWVDTMMMEELHFSPEQKSPFKSALVTFLSFLVAGAIPLAAFLGISLLEPLASYAFWLATAIALLTMFVVGAMRSVLIHTTWYRSGTEMLFVGGMAAAVAYIVGYLLQGLA